MGVNDRLLGDDLTLSADVDLTFFVDDDDSGLIVFGFDPVAVVVVFFAV